MNTNTFRTIAMRLILAALCLALLAAGVLLSPVAVSNVSAARPAQSLDEGDDPDVPPLARGLIEKEEYLRRRGQHIDKLRGLPYDEGDNPRVRAIREMEEAERAGGLALTNQKWESVGPAPLPNGQTEGISTPVSGRTIAIAIHPTNPNIVYVGTAQGGLYRTLDGGTTWKAIFDNALSLAVGAITIAPSEPSTIFVGTGEPNFSCDSYFGVGVYRIRNADTLPILEGPFNSNGAVDVMSGRAVSRIVVHPTDPNIIFVATASGIGGIGCDIAAVLPDRGLYRSTNAMSVAPTFTRLTTATANLGNRSHIDVVMEPGNSNTVVCSVAGLNGIGDGGIYRTANALDANPVFTRTLTLGTASATVRSELAINRVGVTTTIFAASSDASGAPTCGTNGTLRRSTDGGQTWSTPLAAANGFCGGQCGYNISVACDPNNASNVIIGGTTTTTCGKLVGRSTNGGSTFTNVATGVHADNHAAAFAPSNPGIAWVGTDGGIYKSTNGGASWTSFSNTGFNATQFQSLALHPTDREFMIGGTQDNGTEFKRPDGTWIRADFGDGGFALIDQTASDTTNVTMYHTYFNLPNAQAIARVTNTANATDNGWTVFGCGFGGVIPNGLQCNATATQFYAPMALGPGNPNTLYFGSDRLYRSTNQGALMTVASQNPIAGGVAISAIGISPQDDNVRLVGLENGQVFRTTTGSSSLTDVTGPIPARYIARAVIDPNNANTAYVTLAGFGLAAGQHVWKTTNLNATPPTWVTAGSGIPDVPVNAAACDPANSNNLYAGTDIGVYRSTDGGASWQPFSTGLPRVAVFDMQIQNANRLLRIATHGRGIWEISVSPFTLGSFRKAFAAIGGSGTVNVTGPSGPAWTATTAEPWITITNPGPGTGNGTVMYTVAANPNPTARSGVILIANQTFTVRQGANFADVPPSNIFYNEIGLISAFGVTLGCGGGNYCPGQAVTREQMAAFIIRALGEPNPITPANQRFPDVPPSNIFYAFIEEMALRQITLGCGGGNYCPSANVTREQMAAFIIRALGELNPPTPGSQRFDDVPPSNIFYNFIDRMAVLQITLGCSQNPPLYCPAASVTREQMAAFLTRAFDLDQ